MENERDEAFLIGQTAGIIAALLALVQASPPSTRKRMLQNLRPQFKSLIDGMRKDGMTEAQAERKGAEWVRELFLKQIAKAEKKPKVIDSSAVVDSIDFEI